jgi:hypothetical protein
LLGANFTSQVARTLAVTKYYGIFCWRGGKRISCNLKCRFYVLSALQEIYLEDPGMDGRIILKWIFERLGGGVEWIDLAQDREKRRAVVHTVMNLRVP